MRYSSSLVSVDPEMERFPCILLGYWYILSCVLVRPPFTLMSRSPHERERVYAREAHI